MKSESSTSRRGIDPSRGFTLMELLVVIVIIAALAAIIFTVTTRVRAQAITAADTGKLR